MVSHGTTLEGSVGVEGAESSDEPPSTPALVVVWASEPARLGETLLVPRGTPIVFGRGGPDPGESLARPPLVRQRPGSTEPSAIVDNPFLSRNHLRLESDGAAIHVENVGKRALTISGREAPRGVARPGDTIAIKGLFTFLCCLRPTVLRALSMQGYPIQPFGVSDPFGIVGESVLAWDLRDRIAFFAARNAHVLLTGASGTGKELAAQAIHHLSARRAHELVARNAATLPGGLIDAELFGNVASYPNAGMPERPGLIGEAHESTLFLDEIGELPAELQTHLLRVLDDGEYQRLGDARRRDADFRLIAATNRAASELKHDLLARLGLRLEMPDLNARRDDVPLIARHLLRRTAARDPALGARFFGDWDGAHGEPRIGAELMRALVTHPYTSHVRELDALLWRALSTSRGGFADLTDAVRAELAKTAVEPPRPEAARVPTAEEVRAALARHDGVRERAWRDLGLPSRHAFYRLLKKYGIADADDDPNG